MNVTLKAGVKIQSYLFVVCCSIKLRRNVHTSYFQLYSFTTNEKHYVVLMLENEAMNKKVTQKNASLSINRIVVIPLIGSKILISEANTLNYAAIPRVS